MGMSKDERERREKKDGITRRDFLDGAAVSAAGLAAAAAFPGLTGAEAMAKAAAMPACRPATTRRPSPTRTPASPPRSSGARSRSTDRRRREPSQVHSTKGGPGIHARVEDTREKYDCVIVGAGASGISAAKYYQDRFGPKKKILIIDALPDFGGHSHRNEWHIPNAANGNADVKILRNGGTVNLDSIGSWNRDAPGGIPGSYGQPAVDFLAWAGVDVADATKWQNGGAAGIPGSFGLYQRLLFPAARVRRQRPRDRRPATPGRSRARSRRPSAGWTAFLNRTPYSQAAQGRDPARADRRRGLPRQRAGRAADAGAEARLPDDDHLQAVPAQPRRRQRRGVPRRVLARLGRAARRRRPGRLGRRLLDPRPPGIPGRRRPRRHRGHRARRDRPDAVPGLALRTTVPRARGRTATPRCCGWR